jgi:hypothetical protein
VSLSITDEHSHDTTESRKILNPIASKSKIFCGKGSYDSRSNFNFLHSRGIDAVILPRERSSTLSRGSPYRVEIARRMRNK